MYSLAVYLSLTTIFRFTLMRFYFQYSCRVGKNGHCYLHCMSDSPRQKDTFEAGTYHSLFHVSVSPAQHKALFNVALTLVYESENGVSLGGKSYRRF